MPKGGKKMEEIFNFGKKSDNAGEGSRSAAAAEIPASCQGVWHQPAVWRQDLLPSLAELFP